MPNKPKSAAIWNPFTAKSRADRSAQEMYPGKIGQDDQRDAARHMLASGYLAKAWSPGVADLIGKAHEFKETPFRHLGALAGVAQHRYDRPIDLHNNTLGIELAQKAGSMEEFERLVNEAAERARPTQTPGAPWVPSAKDAEAMRKGSAQYAKGGSVAAFQDGGAAFGVFPQMRPKRTRQDPEAAKDVPLALARGAVSGVLGAPGDIESLIRMLPGLDESRTILPTSEDIQRRLPMRELAATPVGKAATNVGALAGGFYTGPGAPLRLAASVPGALRHGATEFAKAAGQPGVNVVKQKGGNWIDDLALKGTSHYTPGMLSEVLEPLKKYNLPDLFPELGGGPPPNTPANEAINKWIDQKLGKYIRNEMATPEDPIRALAEQGITHVPGMENITAGTPNELKWARESAGYPKGMAKSPLAKKWEKIADLSVNPLQLKDFNPSSGKGIPTAEWAGKAGEETPVNAIRGYRSLSSNSFRPSLDDGIGFDKAGFDHVVDVLGDMVATGRIRPEQLNKVSLEQAIRMTHQYDVEMAEKAAKTTAVAREGLPVYKEYPEGGMRWVELNRPGSFASESDAMGHSVRGYEPPKGHPDWVEGSGDAGHSGYGHGGWEAIKSGRAKVYSLVDEKGKPHVTVEVKSGRKLTEADLPNDVRDDLAEAYGDASREEFEAAVQQALAKREIPQQITQIKGKQNAAPKEDYLPFVQDFVRSGQWGDVGDLQNTGLIKHESGKYISKAEMDALSRKHFGEKMGNKPDASESPEQYYKRMSRYDPEYLSETDKAFVEDWKAGNFDLPEGYAGGGSVKTGIKEGVNLARRSLFGLRPSQDMAGRELVPVQKDLDRMQAELAKAEKVAPKVEQKTTTVTPSPTAPKIEQTVRSIAETPVSRRTVLKTAAGQVMQNALPASSFADLMKPATVAKQAVQAAAPAALSMDALPALLGEAIRKGMDEKQAVDYVRQLLPDAEKRYFVDDMYHTYKNPELFHVEGEPQGAGEIMRSMMGMKSGAIGGDPLSSMRPRIRAMRERAPEMYDELRQTAKDIAEYGFEP